MALFFQRLQDRPGKVEIIELGQNKLSMRRRVSNACDFGFGRTRVPGRSKSKVGQADGQFRIHAAAIFTQSRFGEDVDAYGAYVVADCLFFSSCACLFKFFSSCASLFKRNRRDFSRLCDALNSSSAMAAASASSRSARRLVGDSVFRFDINALAHLFADDFGQTANCAACYLTTKLGEAQSIGLRFAGTELGDAQIGRCDFAALFFRLKCDGLTVIERTNAGCFERGCVDENVLSAVIRSDEAVALLRIIPFHSSSSHFRSFTNMALKGRVHSTLEGSNLCLEECKKLGTQAY